MQPHVVEVLRETNHSSLWQEPVAVRRASEIRIDALRGLAALAVVLFHSRCDLWSGWAYVQSHSQGPFGVDWMLAWLGVPMHFMGAGVLVFFVVSGYCIHQPQAAKIGQAREGDDHFRLWPPAPNWRRFYIRRFFRIYPPYVMTLLLSSAVLAMTMKEAKFSSGRLLPSLLMVQAYWPPGGQVPTNPSLWSLPVEMELYLVYPLAWWLGRKLGWTWMLLMAALVSVVAQRAEAAGVQWLGASVPKFWGLWCAGAWMAERRERGLLPRWNRGWTLVLLAALALASGSEMAPSLAFLSLWLWGAFALLALLWAVGPDSKAEDVLPRTWLRAAAWLGVCSYSLYLIHYPLFYLAGAWWTIAFGEKSSNILVALFGAALVIPLARWAYVWVERPSHRLARELGADAS